MGKLIQVVAALAALVTISSSVPGGTSAAAVLSGYQSDGDALLSPGVRHDWGRVLVDDSQRAINIVDLNPASNAFEMRVSTAAGRADTRDTVLEQALAVTGDGHRVVASINGSLFNFQAREGDPDAAMAIGLNMIDTELINAVNTTLRPSLPVFAIDDAGMPTIGAPTLAIDLTLPSGVTVPLDRVNQGRGDALAVLYTPRLGASTGTNADGFEYVIEGFDLPIRASGEYAGQVVSATAGVGNTAIGPGQVVLSVSNTKPDWPGLAVGDEITLSTSISDGWDAMVHTLAGKDMLLVDGTAVPPGPQKDPDDARAAVGIDAEGQVMLVTVDDGTYAHGLSITQLTQLMLNLGAVDAMNLDGGTSTQMAVRLPGDIDPSMVNTRLKPGDRPVANALQVISHFADGPLDSLVVAPGVVSAAVGEVLDFTAKGRDAHLNGVDLSSESLAWSVTQADGAAIPVGTVGVQQSGTRATITAHRAGQYRVTVAGASLSATATLNVTNDTTVPSLSLPKVVLTDSPPGPGKVAVTVSWNATDNVGIQRVELQRKTGTGSWQAVALPAPLSTTANPIIPFSTRVQFRVRATDVAGNTSSWKQGRAYRVTAYNEGHSAVHRSGAWSTRKHKSAIARRYARTAVAGANVWMSFKGVQVAAIGNWGPAHSTVDLSLNQAYVGSATITNPTLEYRRVLFLSPALNQLRSTTIQLTNRSGGSAPMFDFDAFLVLRTTK